MDSQQYLDSDKSKVANIVYKSTDGGKTWKDISEGLPEIVGYDEEGTHINNFFADDRGLYLSAGNFIYHNKPGSTASVWSKEILPDDHKSIAPAGKTGIFAYNYEKRELLRNTQGSSTWTPTYGNLKVRLHTFLETAGGTVFIGTDRRLFRSADSGKNWQEVMPVGWVLKLVESNGVLIAATTKGINRSTNDGQSWELVTREDCVGIALEKNGFAAINTPTGVQTSYDGGKTWNLTFDFPGDPGISSIAHVGEYLLCSSEKGIYRSSDKGTTWKLILPSVDDKVFNLSASGNVIYAIPRAKGC